LSNYRHPGRLYLETTGGSKARRRHLRPADEYPYAKPFQPDFIDCPAFQATQMVTLDLSHRPLGSVITCRHLESRLIPTTNYRRYGACVLGDAEARRRWTSASASRYPGPGATSSTSPRAIGLVNSAA
jgi:hypothetical protein